MLNLSSTPKFGIIMKPRPAISNVDQAVNRSETPRRTHLDQSRELSELARELSCCGTERKKCIPRRQRVSGQLIFPESGRMEFRLYVNDVHSTRPADFVFVVRNIGSIRESLAKIRQFLSEIPDLMAELDC